MARNVSLKTRKLTPMKRTNGEENATQLVPKWPNSREETRISEEAAVVLEIAIYQAKAVNKEKIGEVSFLKSQGRNPCRKEVKEGVKEVREVSLGKEEREEKVVKVEKERLVVNAETSDLLMSNESNIYQNYLDKTPLIKSYFIYKKTIYIFYRFT